MNRVLIADDIEENRYLLEVLLKGSGYAVDSAENGEEALRLARANPPDVIVTDILMPVMDGFALCRAWKADPVLSFIPFIFYTATYTSAKDEEFALSLGAERFVVKPQPSEALIAIIQEVLEEPKTATSPVGEVKQPKSDTDFLQEYNEVLFRKLEKKMKELEGTNRALAQEVEDRKRQEVSLRESEQKFKALIDSSPMAIGLADKEGRIQYVNREFIDLFGYRLEEIPTVEDWFVRAYPDARRRETVVSSWMRSVQAAEAEGGGTRPFEGRVTCADGSVRDVTLVSAVISGFILASFVDMTEQKKLEGQLRQAQKMEAIGTLAGGIAHDFNNILTPIIGYTELVRMRLPEGSPIDANLGEVLNAARRAQTLVRQILAFSRQTVQEKMLLEPSSIIKEAMKLLRASVPTTIKFDLHLAPLGAGVMADPTQIHQVVMNLCTNAYQAMKETGGVLRVALGSRQVEEQDAWLGLPPGLYMLLEVRDSGCGMDSATKERIFEPYFTTKAKGEGTGLGLAVVHGIVKSLGGHISVYSEPGKGSQFNVYLPVVDLQLACPTTEIQQDLPRGQERILVVDDEVVIVRMLSLLLEDLGYTVIGRCSSIDAWELFAAQPDGVDLVITDMTMPDMTGVQLAGKIHAQRPELPIILCSGLSEQVATSKARESGISSCLSKPVLLNDLALAVRTTLDSLSGSGEGHGARS